MNDSLRVFTVALGLSLVIGLPFSILQLIRTESSFWGVQTLAVGRFTVDIALFFSVFYFLGKRIALASSLKSIVVALLIGVLIGNGIGQTTLLLMGYFQYGQPPIGSVGEILYFIISETIFLGVSEEFLPGLAALLFAQIRREKTAESSGAVGSQNKPFQICLTEFQVKKAKLQFRQ